MKQNIDARASSDDGGQSDWKTVHERLRQLSRQRAAQDYEIGRLLLQAERLAVYFHLGFGSGMEYVEFLFGFDGRQSIERLRVARALEELPQLSAALQAGELSWSAVRELSRVAVPQTEAEWIEAARRRTARQIERMVSGRERGARPGDVADPARCKKVLRFEVSAETEALLREAIGQLRQEVGQWVSEEDALGEICRRSLGGDGDASRAPYQIALTVCEQCSRTWQQGDGEAVEVGAEVGERAQCDAQRIGHPAAPPHVGSSAAAAPAPAEPPRAHVGSSAVAALAPAEPPRAHVGSGAAPAPAPAAGRTSQRVRPAVRRQAFRRAEGRCEVPSCRNRRNLELHHLRLRSEGGLHDLDNIAVLCKPHHTLEHRGVLLIEGRRRTGLQFLHADGTPYGAPALPDAIETNKRAFDALRNLGFGQGEVKCVLAAARRDAGAEATLEQLVREALRHFRAGSADRQPVAGAPPERTEPGPSLAVPLREGGPAARHRHARPAGPLSGSRASEPIARYQAA